jgi:ribosome recycling factor
VIEDLLKEAKQKMQASIHALQEDLAVIRTGRASPALVEKLSVEYYGQPTQLVQLASIAVPEPRQLLIRPFDISSIGDIEKAIHTSELGLTPNNDGKVIRLNLPALTEERRKELVKVVQSRVEEARISVRNTRRDTIKDMRDSEEEKLVSENELHRGEDEAQKLTDLNIKEIEKQGDDKEKEVMEV